jgi:uroporphyrin-III C-methyltransferase/precorrin-2 dehydrogenase/sirohydrochlorin ferrochelatase
VVTGRLDQLDTLAHAHAIRSPALAIIGEVAALAGSLAWFGAAPLGAGETSLCPASPVISLAAQA